MMAKLERPANGGIRVHWYKKGLDQEIERLAVHFDAGNLHPLYIHCSLAVGGADARRNANGPLAIQQLRHQPPWRMALRAAQLAEVDKRGPRSYAGAHDLEIRVPDALRHFMRHVRVQLTRCQFNVRSWTKPFTVNEIKFTLGGQVVARCREQQRRNRRNRREET